MRIIGNMQDIECLRNARLFRKDYLSLVEKALQEVTESMEELGCTFDPEANGFQILLEPGDNIRNLAAIGLPDGLLESSPEFCEAYNLGGVTVYRIGILYNNECMYQYYCTMPGWADIELEEWLKENAIVKSINEEGSLLERRGEPF